MIANAFLELAGASRDLHRYRNRNRRPDPDVEVSRAVLALRNLRADRDFFKGSEFELWASVLDLGDDGAQKIRETFLARSLKVYTGLRDGLRWDQSNTAKLYRRGEGIGLEGLRRSA